MEAEGLETKLNASTHEMDEHKLIKDVRCNGMYCCGRYWCISYRDLAGPSFCTAIIHLSFLLGVGSLVLSGDADCGSNSLTAYIFGALLLQAIEVLLSFILLLLSACCTSWGVHSFIIAYLVQVRYMLIFLDVGWGVFGIVSLAQGGGGDSCSADPAKMGAIALVVVALFLACSHLVCLRCSYNTQGDNCENMGLSEWRMLCSSILCVDLWKAWSIEDLSNGGILDSAIHEVRAVFGGILGFTPSDVARVLKLVRDQQRLRVRNGHEFIIPDQDNEENGDVKDEIIDVNETIGQGDLKRNSITSSAQFGLREREVLKSVQEWQQPELSAEDTKRLRELKYYFKYAVAACGWPIFLCHEGLCGISRGIGCQCCWKCCQGMTPEQEANIRYNSCACRSSLPSFIFYSGLQPENLLMANMSVDIDRTIYYVATDPAKNALVIAVRGTMSAQDLITDARQQQVRFPLPPSIASTVRDVEDSKGKPKQENKIVMASVAEGFYKVCQRIIDDLKNCPAVKTVLESKDITHIVVTGHSLGGAITSILPVLLMNDTFFNSKTIKGFAIAPPPTFPKSVAQSSGFKKMMTALVYANDLVPRLSIYTSHKLRLQAINAMRKAKGKRIRDIMYADSAQGEHIVDEKDLLNMDPRNAIPFHIPGVVYHMKTRDVSCKILTNCYQALCCWLRGFVAPKGTYQTIVYRCKSDSFQEIIIDSQMAHEHLPSSYQRAVQEMDF
ncbi:hypothetical protein AAMO2058_001237100 [Amorphochlora amoebiformis]